MGLLIRKEFENDYRQVEELTREAFWNLHVPGCDEHWNGNPFLNKKGLPFHHDSGAGQAVICRKGINS